MIDQAVRITTLSAWRSVVLMIARESLLYVVLLAAGSKCSLMSRHADLSCMFAMGDVLGLGGLRGFASRALLARSMSVLAALGFQLVGLYLMVKSSQGRPSRRHVLVLWLSFTLTGLGLSLSGYCAREHLLLTATLQGSGEFLVQVASLMLFPPICWATCCWWCCSCRCSREFARRLLLALAVLAYLACQFAPFGSSRLPSALSQAYPEIAYRVMAFPSPWFILIVWRWTVYWGIRFGPSQRKA
mmetsp:Transcript_70004/g.193638  ORF Transcript_70004/g.193638 Transcript_70004/m.193638 type:complete len:244 (+) Transcript_70004:3-734(+)